MKQAKLFNIVLSFFLLLSTCQAGGRVLTGDEIFVQRFLNLIKGKRVGIITNQSGMLQDGRHIVDVLAGVHGTKVVALFGPEHGIRGTAPAGAVVGNGVDEKTGIPIFSLYGRTNKPTPEMLKGIDVLIYDIQDVGARFYTYISTLDLTLEAAAENRIEYIVLDRPDMLRADFVDGPVLVDSLKSFVGIQPIPSVYGMTPGELATMFNEAGWIAGGNKANLRVIKMENYDRKMWYDQTGLLWQKPSPNLPDMASVEVYPGTVLIEATNISEGRGTEKPFEYIGAPFINGKKLANLLNQQHIKGVRFEKVDFKPESLPWANNPKYEGEICHGVKIVVTDRNRLKPVEMGIYLLWALRKLYPDSLKVRPLALDRLAGTPVIRKMIYEGKHPGEIISSWQKETEQFSRFREKFLLYK
ncbi:MAG: exo-beta-N-acetylmuramidase NamZ family protein [Candidatus Kryptoniota bacterium]